MHLFYAPDITGTDNYRLSEKESHHIINVLRSVIGDKMHLTDGKGNIYETELIEITKKYGIVRILSHKKHPPKRFKIHIAIAPPKTGDRVDFLLEKLTELGADIITPLESQNSERRKFNREKEEHTLISAIKQSGNPFLPVLNEMTGFNKFITSIKDDHSEKYICYCSGDTKDLLARLYQAPHNVIICIGPEGDFTEEEVKVAMENKFIPAGLGDQIMRTETAGILCCGIINTINQLSS